MSNEDRTHLPIDDLLDTHMSKGMVVGLSPKVARVAASSGQTQNAQVAGASPHRESGRSLS